MFHMIMQSVENKQQNEPKVYRIQGGQIEARVLPSQEATIVTALTTVGSWLTWTTEYPSALSQRFMYCEEYDEMIMQLYDGQCCCESAIGNVAYM